MRDNVPADHAVAVARLEKAGAILLGKTTTTEFAHSMMGRSPLTGTTFNPWNRDFTCGGSSCGAGVAVVTGMGLLALATDAGASTRLPAALAGIAGLKPTLGVIPHNQVPDGFGNFIHLGLMARDIDAIARMLDAVSGAHAADPHSLARPATRAVERVAAGCGLSGKNIGVLRMAGNRRLGADAAAALDVAIRAFETQGARISALEFRLDNPEIAWRTLQQVNWAARFAVRLEEIRPEIDASYAQGIAEGAALSGLALQRAIQKRTDIFRAVQGWFGEVDFVLSPVASRGALAADHGVLDPIAVDGESVGDMRGEWTPYLSLFDLSGHPAIALPAGADGNGVPLGVQLVGRWHDDAGLLAAAAEYERAAPWVGRVEQPR
jgi:aspartyl-tRNA(Asn)/glutamyl-tRNA(Gln) amidotransferase subunit A